MLLISGALKHEIDMHPLAAPTLAVQLEKKLLQASWPTKFGPAFSQVFFKQYVPSQWHFPFDKSQAYSTIAASHSVFSTQPLPFVIQLVRKSLQLRFVCKS